MIGRLRGIILEKQPPLVLLETGGVGYEVHMPMTLLLRATGSRAGSHRLHPFLWYAKTRSCCTAFNNKQERTPV